MKGGRVGEGMMNKAFGLVYDTLGIGIVECFGYI